MARLKKHQFTFSGGEISPVVLARSDIERFQSSMAIVRNWIPEPQGGVSNRPGTELVGYEWIDIPSLVAKTGSATGGTDPAAVVDSGHGLSTGDHIMCLSDAGQGGDFRLIGHSGQVEVIDASNFLITNIDMVGTGAHSFSYFALNSSVKQRAVPFVFNTDDAYTLYFGDRSMMVARDGALVLESTTEEVTGWDYSASTVGLTLSGTPDLWSGEDVFIGDGFDTSDPRAHANKRYKVTVGGGSPDTGVTAITNANPIVLTYTTHPLATGYRIYFSSVGGMTELRGTEWLVEKLDANTFTLSNRWGEPVDSTSWGVYTGADSFYILDATDLTLMETGLVGADSATGLSVDLNRYLVVRTPWASTDLPNIDYAQTEDTLTITCPGFVPRQITRSAHDVWTITEQDFRPNIEPPAPINGAFVGISRNIYVTSVSKETGEESYAQEQWTGADATNTIDWPAVDDAFEYNIYHSPVGDYTPGFDTVAIYPLTSIVTTSSETPDPSIRPPTIENPFEVQGTPAAITAITVGGAATPLVVTTTGTAHGIVAGQNLLIRGITGGTIELNNRKFEALSATTDTVTLRYTDQDGYTPWSAGGNVIPLLFTDYPTAVAYDQQRLILANTPTHPRAVYMSRSRNFGSMNISIPPQPDDAVSLEIAGVQANEIRWLVPMQELIAMTASGVYTIIGDSNGVFVPDPSPQAVPQYAFGVGTVKPVVVGGSVIYVSAQGSTIFELVASSDLNQAKTFVPQELSALAPHLFLTEQVESLTYAQYPNSVIWGTRSDGILIGLTYLKEYEVFAWHRHDTPGDFESVSAIPENDLTGTYFSVKRTINSVTKRYFERLASRNFVDVQDAFFVDSGLKYDEAFDVTVLIGDRATFTITIDSGHTFVDGDFFDVEHKIRSGDSIVPGALDGVRYKVDNKTATTIDGVTLLDAVVDATTALAGIDTRTLTVHRCTQSVTGLDHLAGATVAILADGSVKTSQVVDSAGGLSFSPDYHSRVIAGLAIEADLYTLPPDSAGGPFQSLNGMIMKLEGWTANLYRSRGLQVGATPDATLEDIAWRIDEAFDQPTNLQTGVFQLPVEHDWGQGRLFIRQDKPLPATILSLATKLEEDAD